MRDFLCQHRCRSIRFPAATAQIGCGELAQRALLADWLLLIVTYLPTRQQPRDTYTIYGIFVYVCPGQRWHHALHGTVAGIADHHHETRTQFGGFLCTCVQSGQQSSARTALWPSRPQRLNCSTRRTYIPSAVPANRDRLKLPCLDIGLPIIEQ